MHPCPNSRYKKFVQGSEKTKQASDSSICKALYFSQQKWKRNSQEVWIDFMGLAKVNGNPALTTG
jgi:hypothetical protein